MCEPGIDTRKVRHWASRIKPQDLVWLRNTVNFALTTPYDLKEFISTSLDRAGDPRINRRVITSVLAEFSEDEIVWFCDNYKQPPQHEKRRAAARRSARRADSDE